MRENSVDRRVAAVGTWAGLRAFEAEIQAGLAQDAAAIAKALAASAPASSQAFRAEATLRPLISGIALVGLGVMAWLAVPQSRPAVAAAGASATPVSSPALVGAGGGRAPARPVALRPALSD